MFHDDLNPTNNKKRIIPSDNSDFNPTDSYIEKTLNLIKNYINHQNWRIKENANSSFSLQGLNDHIVQYNTALFWLYNIYEKEIREAHIKGDLHIHDLGYLSTYCFPADTEIKLYNNKTISIKELVDNFNKKEYFTITYDLSKKKNVVSKIKEAKLTRKNAELYQVFFKKNGSVICTEDHPFLLVDDQFKKAIDLKEDDCIRGFIENHYVKKVVKLDKKEDVYDITVDHPSHNFLLARDVFVHNCVGWSLEDLLLRGFGGVSGKLKSRPPKHFRSALGQIWNFFYTMQGEAAGAQAFSSFDTYLAPFIKYDKLSYSDVKQAIEEFVYNMNVPTRAGFQTPFTNITLDIWCPKTMENKNVIYNGEYTNDKYGDFQEEMLLINKAFCEVLLQGDANQRIFTFPIPTYNITKDFKWENENLDPLWQLTSKYGSPYFANFINSNMSVEDAFSMCLTYNTKIHALINNSLNGTFNIGEIIEEFTPEKIKILTPLGFLPIKRFVTKQVNETVLITLDNNEILEMSLDHPHIVTNSNIKDIHIKQAKDLKLEDKMIFISNYDINKISKISIRLNINETKNLFENYTKTTKIKNIEFKKYSKPIKVYDIEIEDKKINENKNLSHLFFANNILTHNCCRLRIDKSVLRNRGGGLFGSNPLTGSIGVVTINLPRIGYLSKSKKEFFSRLDNILELSVKSLITKRTVLEEYTENNLYPYSKIYLSNIKKRFGSFWANHFNTIGIVGMNECCLNFIKKDILSEEGLNLAKETLIYIRDKLTEYQLKYNTPFNLEATPAESTCYRLAKIDSEKYKNIITAGTKENPYYTNSTQINPKQMGNLFNDLEHQNELQPLYTGGTVFHIYLGENVDDNKALKLLIKKICENYKIPYISITPIFSICPKCGFIKGHHKRCPF